MTCAFTHYETAPAVKLYVELYRDAVPTEHTSQPIDQLFISSVTECQHSKTNVTLVKNSNSDPQDSESGLGIVSYDSTNDILIVDATDSDPSVYSSFIQIITANGMIALRKVEVTTFKVAYSQTEIVREYPYAGT